MEIILICKSCGKSYSIDSEEEYEKWEKRFCSLKCKSNGYHAVKVLCSICGKEFLARRRVKDGNRYCSKECQYKGISIYRTGKFTGKDNPTYKEKIKLTCLKCGKDYFVYPSRLKNGPSNYCSKECQYADRHGKYTGRNSPRWNENTYVNKICECCGKEFVTKRTLHEIGYGKYCSKECRKQMTCGEHAHNWRGGIQYAPYCHKFTREFRTRVREFFGNKCLICGKEKEENGRNLDVHHVDYDKEGACCENEHPLFVTLCIGCHAKTNFDRDMWEEYLYDKIMNEYNGKCYYTKEEYKNIINSK